MFSIVHEAGFDATGFMLDCPPVDQVDATAYLTAIDQYVAAFPGLPARAALISSLPESIAPATREMCLAAGIVPLQGQREALEALNLAGKVGETWANNPRVELRIPSVPVSAAAEAHTLSEHAAKAALAAFGVRVPRSTVVRARANQVVPAAQSVGFPVVIKATGVLLTTGEQLEHKSELGALALNIRTIANAEAAAERLSKLSDDLLIEEMIVDGIAEILVGITVDPQFGQVLVIGAGGVLTEVLRDTVTLLPPFTAHNVEAAVSRLQVSKLLAGFRGKPAGDVPALVSTILACTRYAEVNLNALLELDINPVIVRPTGLGAVAVDALIRLREDPSVSAAARKLE